MGGKTRAQKRQARAGRALVALPVVTSRADLASARRADLLAITDAEIRAGDLYPIERAGRLRGLLWAAAVAWAGVAAGVLVFLAR